MKLHIAFAVFAAVFFLGCPGRAPVRRARVETIPGETLPTPDAKEISPLHRELPGQAAIFYVIHPKGDPEKVLEILRGRPNFRLTLIFPAKYFDDPARSEALEEFRVFQSSGQIEVALTLENEPILPLLGGLKSAAEKTARWGFDYNWPDDIAAQIARGNGIYQQRWIRMPAGLYPPYQAVSEQVVKAARRFRLAWVLAKPNEVWGRREYSPTVLLVPPTVPEVGTTPGGFGWAEKLTTWALEWPLVLIDSSEWSDPQFEPVFLERLAARASFNEDGRLLTGKELTESLIDVPPIASNVNVFVYDYTPWTQSQRQRLAWMALAQARAVIKPYGTSGQTSMQMLDAAYEELHQAQSGPFLLALGQTEVPLTSNERNFLATLSNVYRLSGMRVPPNLGRWFSDRGVQRTIKPEAPDDSRPFFVEGVKQLSWNDPLADDVGPGKYVYPTGRYPKGSFDLSQFGVRWTDSQVTFDSFLSGFSPSRAGAVVPAIHIYIDVNRLPDAGSTTLLKMRGSAAVAREAAWEYAISMHPGFSTLFQAVPGGTPRRLKSFKWRTLNTTISTGGSHYYIEWDGKNDHGAKVASGAYIAQMKIGGGHEKFFKMAVLK